MALSGNQDDVARLRQQAGGLDCLAAVGDADGLLHVVLVESGEHVVDDVLRLLEAGVVGGDDDTVAQSCRLLCHEGTFAFVAVAAGTHHGDDFPLAFQHAVDGVQHVDQGIGRVGVVHDGGESLRRAEGVETSGYGVEGAECHQHVFFLLAQQHGGSEHRQQVACVELADEADSQFTVVEVEQHPFEVRLQHLALEVAEAAQRVGIDVGTGVLCHHQSVPVVQVGQAESPFGQVVEEFLLCLEVVLHRLVVV